MCGGNMAMYPNGGMDFPWTGESFPPEFSKGFDYFKITYMTFQLTLGIWILHLLTFMSNSVMLTAIVLFGMWFVTSIFLYIIREKYFWVKEIEKIWLIFKPYLLQKHVSRIFVCCFSLQEYQLLVDS
jgi:hypothetical protein